MSTIKKTILFIVSIIFLCGCNDKNNDIMFKANLKNEPYIICGKEIHLSDYSYDYELEVGAILEDIEEYCNFQKTQVAKDEISNLLDDDSSYSRREILEILQKIYYLYLDN